MLCGVARIMRRTLLPQAVSLECGASRWYSVECRSLPPCRARGEAWLGWLLVSHQTSLRASCTQGQRQVEMLPLTCALIGAFGLGLLPLTVGIELDLDDDGIWHLSREAGWLRYAVLTCYNRIH